MNEWMWHYLTCFDRFLRTSARLASSSSLEYQFSSCSFSTSLSLPSSSSLWSWLLESAASRCCCWILKNNSLCFFGKLCGSFPVSVLQLVLSVQLTFDYYCIQDLNYIFTLIKNSTFFLYKKKNLVYFYEESSTCSLVHKCTCIIKHLALLITNRF